MRGENARRTDCLEVLPWFISRNRRPPPTTTLIPDEHVEKVSCGAEFTAIIDSRGRLLTFGSPQEGQLGSGTTGEFIEKAGKISYDLVLSPSVISVFISKVRRRLSVPSVRKS